MKYKQALQARIDNFEQHKADLEGQGYQSQKVVIGIVMANILALLIGVVAAIVMGIGYVTIHKSGSYSITISSMFLFIIVFLLLAIVHEFLHGITFACFCEHKWKSIQFGIIWKYVTPYCSCLEVLNWKYYLMGGLMPFLVLGIGFYLIALWTGSFWMLLLSVLNVIGAGGDLVIVYHLLRNHDGIIMDCPQECGYMRFYKSK